MKVKFIYNDDYYDDWFKLVSEEKLSIIYYKKKI